MPYLPTMIDLLRRLSSLFVVVVFSSFSDDVVVVIEFDNVLIVLLFVK